MSGDGSDRRDLRGDGGPNPVAELAVRFAREHQAAVAGTGGGSGPGTLVGGGGSAHGVGHGHGHDEALAAVWVALRSAGMDAPGLRFGRWVAASLFGGVLPTLLANSPDVGALLERLHRFHPLFGPDRIVLGGDGRSTWLGLDALDGGPAHPDTVDACFALVVWLTRRLTGGGSGPRQVTLRRPAPVDRLLYRELLGEVRFGAGEDRCRFDAGGLAARIELADPSILAALEPYAQRRLAEQGRSWTARVAELVAAELQGPPPLASVAAALAVSPRTLQLRLADEGTTYSAVVERAQRDRALTLLRTSDLPVTVVATTVGFSSPAVLARAVRRWTGLTPTAYRRSGGRG